MLGTARTSSVLTFLGDVKYIQDVLLLVQFFFLLRILQQELAQTPKIVFQT